ncbi:MAG TPA: hypothetical protein VIR81_09585, partial [Myxococcales bacterium]
MSSEAEFRPIESAPARRLWIYAVLGAVIVGLVVYILQSNQKTARAAEPRQIVTANLAPRPVADPVKEAPKAEPAAAAQKAPESPNVLG